MIRDFSVYITGHDESPPLEFRISTSNGITHAIMSEAEGKYELMQRMARAAGDVVRDFLKEHADATASRINSKY